MAEMSTRDAKLVQYLSEALAKEKELETALTADIGMTTRAPYKKRLKEHLRETKAHARQLERRIKQLGGGGALSSAVSTVAARGLAAAKAPLHAIRGSGEQEKMLKNAKSQYSEEHEEIATYTAIETLAAAVGDAETAKLARAIRREEERMAKFLEKLIPTLTKAVMQEEIPAAERRTSGGRRASASRSTRSRSSGSSSRAASGTRSGGSRSAGSSRSGGSRSASGTRSASGARSGGSRAASGARAASRSRSNGSPSASSSRSSSSRSASASRSGSRSSRSRAG
jgi:ferritin-like metal-binding protein YciE